MLIFFAGTAFAGSLLSLLLMYLDRNVRVLAIGLREQQSLSHTQSQGQSQSARPEEPSGLASDGVSGASVSEAERRRLQSVVCTEKNDERSDGAKETDSDSDSDGDGECEEHAAAHDAYDAAAGPGSPLLDSVKMRYGSVRTSTRTHATTCCTTAAGTHTRSSTDEASSRLISDRDSEETVGATVPSEKTSEPARGGACQRLSSGVAVAVPSGRRVHRRRRRRSGDSGGAYAYHRLPLSSTSSAASSAHTSSPLPLPLQPSSTHGLPPLAPRARTNGATVEAFSQPRGFADARLLQPVTPEHATFISLHSLDLSGGPLALSPSPSSSSHSHGLSSPLFLHRHPQREHDTADLPHFSGSPASPAR